MDKERLLEIFEDLLLIHSPSKKEKDVADYLVKFLKNLDADIYLHENQNIYGGNSPVIFAHMKGNLKGEGVTFSAHTDVIEPNKNLKIVKEENIWRTDGKTTLGSDDKAGVCSILYIMEYLKLNNIPHKDIYAIFTPGEEEGMLGAKNIDWNEVYKHMNPAKNMIVIDKGGDAGDIAYQAPTSYNFSVSIYGKTAHAGIEPENGINAIIQAGKFLSRIRTSRIGETTTSNISKISSNFPSNVVPDNVTFSGEVRGKRDKDVNDILAEYEEILKEITSGNYKLERELDYPALIPSEDMTFINDIQKEYQNLGIKSEKVIIGGGSDANFFAKEGFVSAIIGTGMHDVHTKKEYIKLDELYKTVNMVISYLTK